MADLIPLLFFIIFSLALVAAVIFFGRKYSRRQKDLETAFKRNKDLQKRQGR